MIVGTAGHVDHGKTALVHALTGVNTDRLKEEKARGITIDLGFAYTELPSGQVLGFVDVPGHERFVQTMVAGASGIDFALLLVAADDGVMPQTREHLAILDLLDIRRGLILLSKADLASAERRVEVEREIRRVVAESGLAELDILPVSTLTGEGVQALRTRLEREADADHKGGAADAFRLSVDRCFTLSGTGTVVTGTVLSGTVAVGDHVLVSPKGLAARVRSIHAQNRSAERGFAGQRCALNLAGPGIAKDAIARGDVVLDPTLHAPANRIDASLRLLPSESKGIGQWFPVHLHHAAMDVTARVIILDGERLAPGASGIAQLLLDRPIAASTGDRFVLRDTSAQRTIGGGRFLDLRAPARKRRAPERRAQWAALARTPPCAAASALLAVPPHSFDLTVFARDHALRSAQASALADELGLVRLTGDGTDIVLSAEIWDGLRSGLGGTLDAFHAANPDLQGIGLERLRQQGQPILPVPAFRAALRRMAHEGAVALAGAWVHRPGHAVRLTSVEEHLWAKVEPKLDGAERFRPPRVRDIAATLGVNENDIRTMLKRAARMGKVDEVAHDHFFLRATMAEMIGFARDLGAQGQGAWFTAATFRDRMDNGRKVAIQILDFLDLHGVTLRRGDLRRINQRRLDLFALEGSQA